MKILFLISQIKSGGAARVMTCLANRFAQAGDEVALVTTTVEQDEYIVDERIVRLPIGEKGKSGNVLSKNLYHLKRIRAICKEYKPDIVVSFLLEPTVRLIVGTIGMKHKIIVSERSDPNHKYPSFIFRVIAKFFYNLADGMVFQTEGARDWFGKKALGKSEVISNQVDEHFFDIKFSGERRDIVTTGRLSLPKNHTMLIDAFSRIADKTDHNLIIYGDGELRQRYEAQIEQLGLTNRVFLPGSTDDIIGAVSGARLFVLSSDHEGMPNSLLEALALGVPSISTDCPCGGPRTVINDGENGLLVPINDTEAMADKLLWALEHPDEMDRMGHNAAERALSFHPEKVYTKWREFIEYTINK